MSTYDFETVDVFTTQRFGGNPLAVFPDARGLTDERMQALAAELNLSETTFVFPPRDPANTARMRIFNRTAEMAFAGHPSIGTAYVLVRRGLVLDHRMRLEVPAGIVDVEVHLNEDGDPTGGTIEVPQPLTILGEASVADVAACLRLDPSDVRIAVHPPVFATVGNPYVIAELEPAALARCEPDLAAFRRALSQSGDSQERFSLHVYVRDGENVRARMFAPLAGTWEDPATGSANAPLGALLLMLDGGDRLRVEIVQGVEMGRPSLLIVEARRAADGIRSTVSGSCVPVLSGSFREGGAL